MAQTLHINTLQIPKHVKTGNFLSVTLADTKILKGGCTVAGHSRGGGVSVGGGPPTCSVETKVHVHVGLENFKTVSSLCMYTKC